MWCRGTCLTNITPNNGPGNTRITNAIGSSPLPQKTVTFSPPSFVSQLFSEISNVQMSLCGWMEMGKTDQQATRYFMKEFVQTGLGLSKLLEQQLWVGSCSLHLRFLVFSKKKKKKSLNVFLKTSFCFQLKWCIYFMPGILKMLCGLTSFIFASSLMHFTHSRIIRDISEVNNIHNKLSYLVIFLFLVSLIHLHMWSL